VKFRLSYLWKPLGVLSAAAAGPGALAAEPQVDLKTALTEMRDRTWIGEGGKKHKGIEMIGTLWDRGLAQSLGAGRAQTRTAVLGEVEHWCLQHDDGADTLAQFHALADPEAA
jgi:hypothetical protein